jgi:DNA-binding transcriptional regulator YiaG
MPNLMVVLKEEVCRLARKETKPIFSKLHKDSAALKRFAADAKRRIAALEAASKRLLALIEEVQGVVPKAAPEKVEKARFTAKTIKLLRDKLDISQTELGELVGVSTNSVYKWEQKEGRLKLRDKTVEALVAIRKLGKREVRIRLGTKK